MTRAVSDNLIRRLDELAAQHDAVEAQLVQPEVLADHRQVRALSIRKAALEPMVRDYRAYRSALAQMDECRAILAEDGDAELRALAQAELDAARDRAESLIDAVQRRFVTADEHTIGSIIIEVRPGVGGDEAALWAGDLVDMYTRYAAQRGWDIEPLEMDPAEIGGFRTAMLRIAGEGVWANLGYEGGTHQVKRVPATEAQGRVHTSTATVAVLPEPEEVEVDLNRDDVREMITTSQGPGGQNVNKVATAVHLIHEPTGIEVRMQDTKSQAQNREKAWQLLRARLYERQRHEAEAARAQQRRTMIGSGGRAEKIRTYRYKENIVVDHRLGSAEGTFNLTDVMAGDLQPLIDALIERDTAERLAAL